MKDIEEERSDAIEELQKEKDELQDDVDDAQ